MFFGRHFVNLLVQQLAYQQGSTLNLMDKLNKLVRSLRLFYVTWHLRTLVLGVTSSPGRNTRFVLTSHPPLDCPPLSAVGGISPHYSLERRRRWGCCRLRLSSGDLSSLELAPIRTSSRRLSALKTCQNLHFSVLFFVWVVCVLPFVSLCDFCSPVSLCVNFSCVLSHWLLYLPGVFHCVSLSPSLCVI